MNWILFLNFMTCCFNASAFLMQGIVHFPFLDDNYWRENLKITAKFYIIPLLAEISTAWTMLDQTMWVVSAILLVVGWLTCFGCWYYQLQLSEYASVGILDYLVTIARVRALVWLLRVIFLYSWFVTHM